MRRFISIVMSGLLVQMTLVMSADATDIYWQTTSGGDFNSSVNWSPLAVPGSADDPKFTVDGTYTVDITSSVTNKTALFDATNAAVTVNIATGEVWELSSIFYAGKNSGKNNTVILTNGTLICADRIDVGREAGSVGTFLIGTDADVTTSNQVNIGWNGHGTMIISNAAFSMPSNNSFYIGGEGDFSAADAYGDVSIYNTDFTCNLIGIGYGNKNTAGVDSTGILHIADSTITLNASILVGRMGDGTLTMDNTEIKFPAPNNVIIGSGRDNNPAWGNATLVDTTITNIATLGVGSGGSSNDVGTLRIEGNSFIETVNGGGGLVIANSTSGGSTGTVVFTDSSTYQGNHWEHTCAAGPGSRGSLTISGNATADFENLHVGKGVNSVGTFEVTDNASVEITGGGPSSLRLGVGDGSTATMTMSGGSFTSTNGNHTFGLGYGTGSSATLEISGGDFEAINFNCGINAAATGTVTVMGPDATINCQDYFHSNSNTWLNIDYGHGGISPIICSDQAQLNGNGTLSMGFQGYMASIPNITMDFIQCANGFIGDFNTKNEGVFVTAQGGTNYSAVLNPANKELTDPVEPNKTKRLSPATSSGWVTFSTNGLSGPTLDIFLQIDTSGATKTLTELVADMTQKFVTAESVYEGGKWWVKVTTPFPTWGNEAYGWDLTPFDPGMKAAAIAVNTVPPVGTVIIIK